MKNDPVNILFIVLPYLAKGYEKKKNTESVLVFPYGVLSIVSYIKANAKKKINIKILDLNLYKSDEMAEVLKKHLEIIQPDIAAISMMFESSYNHLGWISKQIKDYNNKTIVVLGGGAATVSWTMINELAYIDALCYGEGEYTLSELVDSENLLETLNSNPAWVTRKSLLDNKIPQPWYVENINEVIDIDYELIDIKSYNMREAFSPFSSVKTSSQVRQFFIVTSRGCPFNCVFCTAHSISGKKVRCADVDILIKHVRRLVNDHGMNVLTIYDDQLLFNRPRAKEFFRRLAEFKLRIEAPNGLSVAFIDEEMAALMKLAGLDTVCLAIESGSSHMVYDVIHKPLRLEMVKPVVESLQRNNIFVEGYFVVGLPGEAEEDRDETVHFIKNVGLDWGNFNLAVPLRGSDLYNICKEKGYIDPNYRMGELGMHDYIIKTPDLDPSYIKEKRYLMNLDVNFVNNHRMKIGDYQTAILCFQDVIVRHENHAFAYFYLAKALAMLNKDPKEILFALDKVDEIIKKDNTWNNRFRYFNIDLTAEKNKLVLKSN